MKTGNTDDIWQRRRSAYTPMTALTPHVARSGPIAYMRRNFEMTELLIFVAGVFIGTFLGIFIVCLLQADRGQY